ncbi:MAG: hypothetical protein R3185_05855 [Candidatus Thermoplasmatota archaeon]|nr:hypothetical protein [Candidatus Thermoplasmatota archaeon]
MPTPRKKNMNAFDLLCMERELQLLVDGNFDKAYQPDRSEVLLRFRVSGVGRVDVAVGLGSYVTITD